MGAFSLPSGKAFSLALPPYGIFSAAQTDAYL